MGPVALLGPGEIRKLAAGLNLRPTKTLGQNFVHDPNTIRRIVKAAELTDDDVVLEVGPGLGSLTLGLLATGRPITAVEIDARLAEQLPSTVAERAPQLLSSLTVLTADAMQLTGLPGSAGLRGQPGLGVQLPGPAPTALVANLPYNVAVPVLLHLLAVLPSLTHVLVLVQLEVADRLAAAPGSKVYGVPSAKLAWYGRARRVAVVPATVFWPEPTIMSGLVSFTRTGTRLAVDRPAVFSVIDAAFSQRRKMLRSALAGWAGSAGQAAAILAAAGVPETARGETVDVDGFARIAAAKDRQQ